MLCHDLLRMHSKQTHNDFGLKKRPDKICNDSIIYNKPTRCNSGSIVIINSYEYALHVSDALSVNHQEHYKL